MTAEEAVAYLLRENLLDLGKVVGCGLEVRDVTRRNINFHVAYRTGPGFFLKRQSPGDSSPTMLAEVGIYQRVTQDDAGVGDRIRALHRGTDGPRVRRLIERETGVVPAGAEHGAHELGEPLTDPAHLS